MKKLYSLITASVFTFASLNANATTHNVTVSNFSFSPSNFNAVVGDDVVWTFTGGSHSATSQTIPGAATAFDSGVKTSGTYSYTITTSGSYTYHCVNHSSMVGTFTVSATGISVMEPAIDLLTNAYPNPFKDKMTLKYGKAIESVKIFNVIGEQIKSLELSAVEEKVDVDFEGIPAGIYFIRTYSEGTIVETKKIIKAK